MLLCSIFYVSIYVFENYTEYYILHLYKRTNTSMPMIAAINFICIIRVCIYFFLCGGYSRMFYENVIENYVTEKVNFQNFAIRETKYYYYYYYCLSI